MNAKELVQKLINEQAEDEGLWFEAETAPEANLQNALRKLHAAVESLLQEQGEVKYIENTPENLKRANELMEKYKKEFEYLARK